MRPQQALGRPGTPVIPADWSTAPRVIVGKTWTVQVAIRRPGGTKGDFDPVTGKYTTTPHDPHFTGTARVQVLNAQDQARLVAEQQVTSVGYLVVVDLACDQAQPDDIAKVTGLLDDNPDPTLLNRELIVRSVMRGSLAWERDLICSDTLG